MLNLLRGQKIKMSQLSSDLAFEIAVETQMTGAEVDIVCFGVDAEEHLADESYFIFYNQLRSPEGAICKDGLTDRFTVDLAKMPEAVHKIVFTAAIDGKMVMGQLQQGQISIGCGGQIVAQYIFTGADFQAEKAIILLELYQKENLWRLSVVGKGFNGGLSALLAHFGGEEAQHVAAPAPKVSLTKSALVQKVVLDKAPRLLELTKKAAVSLEKKKLGQLTATVVLVLDASGSMNKQYKTGRVQRILDKTLPLALLFDDDGKLESWAFATKCRRLTEATLDNIDGYIETAAGGWRKWDIGGVNNEPAVLEEIVKKHRKSKLPVYVLFISDGGVSKNKQIKDIIKDAARFPIFWQFVGISGKNYGALEALDEMTGRIVDNANFFALDDIDDIPDEMLYDRLMQEFPQWLETVKAQNIL